jgi:hypothetical protein
MLSPLPGAGAPQLSHCLEDSFPDPFSLGRSALDHIIDTPSLDHSQRYFRVAELIGWQIAKEKRLQRVDCISDFFNSIRQFRTSEIADGLWMNRRHPPPG